MARDKDYPGSRKDGSGARVIAAPTLRSAGPVRHPAGSRLICVAGAAVGQVYRIDTTPALIGREPDAAVSLTSVDISRRHARIVRDPDTCLVIEDLGSTNGTLVNGERVARQRILPGDHIQTGATLFVYAQQDDLAERAQQIQKLQALGSLARSLGHDFKNIFSVLLMSVEFVDHLAQPLGSDGLEIRSSADDMRVAIEQALEIVQRLMHFGRRDEVVDATRVDVSAMVEETAATMRRGLPGIEVEVSIEPGLGVQGQPGDLRQVLLNLTINARDAMPWGGRLSIRAREVDLPPTAAFAQNLPGSGRFVELAVSDTGIGMDEATVGRIFEPFFTTKAVGKGTGLGLSAVYGIVRNLGGTIRVNSMPGRGATFRVLIPSGHPAKPAEVDFADTTGVNDCVNDPDATG